MATEKIRESVIAGSWYPGSPQQLTQEVARYLDEARVEGLNGELVALIVPHAGYMYSGQVAAHAYKLLLGQPFDRVLIVAPSHRAHFEGASIYNLGGFRTPLGVVPLDHQVVDELMQQPAQIAYIPQAHSQEHSLEIQLPFLQMVLKDFRMTPIVMGEQSLANCRKLAAAIARVCQGKKVLLVASTDLSHFHPYEEAKGLDQVVIDRVAAFDPQGLDEDLRRGACEACGGGPMISVMLAAQQLGANRSKILHHANSGDVTGDKRGVVGYLSAALLANPGGEHKTADGRKHRVGVDLGLSSEDKETLLKIARNAILSGCLKQPQPDIPIVSAKLQESRGAFVCVKIKGMLRGCIGCIEARGPLHKIVGEMAEQAAFCDPRFPPLRSEESDRIELEISVLTPFQVIKDPSEIEVGKHGLMIRRGFHSGLLLPQVATENGWDRTQFLEWTCQKAGLPKDAWKDPDAQIQVFSADVF
jgi:AmmeMemoRadiSam system protein B/AmmeMemoRadiSam system protein A